jgi:hypothetical protein
MRFQRALAAQEYSVGGCPLPHADTALVDWRKRRVGILPLDRGRCR